ncbi:hypothetical protein HBB16_16680 [Pseudonocardia sp. MCCB 268]|nr:hypothetical protein [Pseudonocardia cytotoxica]
MVTERNLDWMASVLAVFAPAAPTCRSSRTSRPSGSRPRCPAPGAGST